MPHLKFIDDHEQNTCMSQTPLQYHQIKSREEKKQANKGKITCQVEHPKPSFAFFVVSPALKTKLSFAQVQRYSQLSPPDSEAYTCTS